MPLPAALLAKLQKRGFVKHVETDAEMEEEVIAEDYDDNLERDPCRISSDPRTLKEPWAGCPNKWNIFHNCSIFCQERWGSGKEHPSPKTERKRLFMLKRFPLPNGWEEIYDPGSGRHYYWNTATNDVAWLSPNHPRCKISPSADKLRDLIKENFLEPMDEEEDMEGQSGSDKDSEDEETREDAEREHREEMQRRRDQQRMLSRAKGRPKVRENDLDPMDPASYSEAPRGNWSSGLERKGEAKTGVDTTAAGPLFQMRPYPSPGAVLRMNAELKKKVSSDEEEED